jgi:hypothetical protein
VDGSSHTALSYAHGASPMPLIGQTIGYNLRDTVSRHGDAEALVQVCRAKLRNERRYSEGLADDYA